MKICRLRFCNIHSLRGEHEVDFEQSSLGRAGLFAITGPTGSGKSTLLDVIALALYNRIPRLSGKISRGEIERTGAILTRHTQEAWAEVTYQCKDGVFTSRWSIRINRNGRLNDYHMELADEEGKLLGLNKGDIPDANAQRIGLEYDQFVRAMMLAQGAFAEFLQADRKVRTQLLEKLTNGGIYRKLGERAYHKHREARASIEKQEERRNYVLGQLLEPSQREAQEAQYRAAHNQLETLQKQLKDLEAWQQRKQWRAEWQQKEAAAQKEAAEARQRLDNFDQEHGARLKRHQDLLPHLENLRQWEKQIAEHQRLKEEATRLESAIAESNAQWQKARKTLVEWLSPKGSEVSTSEEDQALLDALDAVCEKVNELQQKRHEKQQAFKHERRQLEQHAHTLSLEWPPLDGKKKSLDEQLEEAARRIHRKAREIADAQHALASELEPRWQEDPTRGRQEITDLRDRFYQLQTAQKQRVDLDKRLVDHQQAHDKLKALVEAAPQKLKEAAQEAEKQEIALKAARAEEENRRLRASLEEHRRNLQTGEACPLCGSTEHPWAEGSPDEGAGAEQVAQLEKSQNEARKRYHAAQKQHELEKQQLEKEQKEIRKLEGERNPCKQQIDQLTQSLPEAYRETSPEQALGALQVQADKLEQWDQLRQTEAPMAALNEGLDKLRQIAEEGQALKDQKEALYTGSNINTEARRHREAIQESRRHLEYHQKQQADNQKQLERQQKLLAETESALVPALRERGYAGIEEALGQRLPETEYERLRQERQAIGQRIEQARELSKQMAAQLSDYPDLAPEQSAEAITAQMNALQEKLPEVQRQRDDLQNRCSQQTKLLQDLEAIEKEVGEQRRRNQKWELLNEYIGDAKGHRFSQFAQDLTLRQLMVLANHRLQKLNPRYALDMPHVDTEGDQLVAIDRDMGDERRSVKTLSGGESFLISLSLALGLSDLAARHVDIRSLFIDEGFGTLDPETLDTTLDILERLQVESDKTIGIISHVDALKERITHQIQLQRNGQGYSSLQVISPYGD